jgi:hypothetical protein
VGKKAASQLDGSGDPPSRDLAGVQDNLGNLLGGRQFSGAHALLERGVRIHEDLAKMYPVRWEYQFELRQFFENMVISFYNQHIQTQANLWSHKAVDLFEVLGTSAASLESERANAHRANLLLRPSGQPEFHILNKDLPEQYEKFAQDNNQSGCSGFACVALRSLESVLPE